MGEGEDFSLISTGDPHRPTTILQILHEAAKLLWRSRQPMLSILLILLLPHALLLFGTYLVVTPLTTDMAVKLVTMHSMVPGSPGQDALLAAAMKDLRELTLAEIFIVVLSFLLSSFLLMAAVHTVAMARKGEQVALKGLLCRIRRTWKGPVVTKLYVAAMTFGCMVLLTLLVGAFVFVSRGSMGVAALAVGAVLAVSAALLLVYLEVVWYQAMVISVVEEGCYGMAALVRATELNRGRRRLGFGVSFLLLLVGVAISMAYSSVIRHLHAGGAATVLVGGLVLVFPGLVANAFMLAVYVVFYYECKKSRGEEGVAMKESLVYSRVPSTGPVLLDAAALP